jgi:DNA-binding NarL/FixJ family response regulator
MPLLDPRRSPVPIRCVVAEDQDIIDPSDRLERDGPMVVVGRARDFEGLKSLIDSTSPDVALVDLGLPGVCRYDTVRTLREWLEEASIRSVGVVAYSAAMSLQSGVWALSDGALAALSKTDLSKAFVSAIARAALGLPTISADYAQWAIDVQDRRSREGWLKRRAETTSHQRAQLLKLAEGDADVDEDTVRELASKFSDLFLEPALKAAIRETVVTPTRSAAGKKLGGLRPATVTRYLDRAFPILFPTEEYLSPSMLDGQPPQIVEWWAMGDHVCPEHALPRIIAGHDRVLRRP